MLEYTHMEKTVKLQINPVSVPLIDLIIIWKRPLKSLLIFMDLLHTITGVNTCNSCIPDLYRLCRIGPVDNI